MANQHQDMGYMNYVDDSESDFKRNADMKKDIRVSDDEDVDGGGGGGGGKMSKANEYFVKELLSERVQIEGKYPHADRLLQQEIANARQNGKMNSRDQRYVDIYNEKPIKVTVKVLVPIKEHPKFNFVGKLLGPKGNSLRRLQEDTMCKMAVMGRGSMKDRVREENFRQSLDPKYGHLNDDLHVEICALAPPAEAHARIAYALAEVRKYLIPDSNDEIRQEQFRELVADGVLPPAIEDEEYYRGRPSHNPPPPPASYSKRPNVSFQHHRSRSPPPTRGVTPAKQKVFSILERSRSNNGPPIDDRYLSNHDDYDSHFDRGYHHPQSQEEMDHHSRGARSRPAEPPPPPMDYRRDYGYRSRSPGYVKSAPDHHHHHHHAQPPPPPPPSHRSASWRGGGGSGSGYPSTSRNHSAAEDHYAPPPPSAHSERRSYRGSPYMRAPK